MKGLLCKVLLWTYLVCSSFESLEAANLHAIFVGDYFSTDIQQACHIDLKNMTGEVKKIAANTGYDLHLKIFAGDESSSQIVLDAVKSLKPGKKDAIIFYFTGHGFRTENNGKSPWPNFEFPLERSGVEMERIIEIIVRKGAVLSIILADCCNLKIPQVYAPSIVKGKKTAKVSFDRVRTNYHHLFCKTRGVIAIAGASSGQPSYCNFYGSFYTQSFLTSLKIAVESSKAEWGNVFDRAEDELQAILKVHQIQQDPVVFTNIK